MRGKPVKSPANSGLITMVSCVIAVLNSNMDLTLWAAARNYLKGEWLKVGDEKQQCVDTWSEPSLTDTRHHELLD